MAAKTHSIFDPAIIVPAIGESFKKLNPLTMLRNPVMFVTEVGAIVTTVLMFTGTQGAPFAFLLQIALWLWFTVLFANFAEAMAEGRGKAQAELFAEGAHANVRESDQGRHRREGSLPSNCARKISSLSRREKSSRVTAKSIEGAATVDESAITGESAPVVREAGGDRSAVTGGTRVLSDIIQGSDYLQSGRNLS